MCCRGALTFLSAAASGTQGVLDVRASLRTGMSALWRSSGRSGMSIAGPVDGEPSSVGAARIGTAALCPIHAAPTELDLGYRGRSVAINMPLLAELGRASVRKHERKEQLRDLALHRRFTGVERPGDCPMSLRDRTCLAVRRIREGHRGYAAACPISSCRRMRRWALEKLSCRSSFSVSHSPLAGALRAVTWPLTRNTSNVMRYRVMVCLMVQSG